MLLEPEAKAIQKAFRPGVLAVAGRKAPAGQHGGFPGHTLAMASFHVRAQFLALEQASLCGGARPLAVDRVQSSSSDGRLFSSHQRRPVNSLWLTRSMGAS